MLHTQIREEIKNASIQRSFKGYIVYMANKIYRLRYDKDNKLYFVRKDNK